MNHIGHPWFGDVAEDLRLLQPRNLSINRFLLSIVFLLMLNLDIFLFDETLSDSQFDPSFDCSITMTDTLSNHDETKVGEYYANFDKSSLNPTNLIEYYKRSQSYQNSKTSIQTSEISQNSQNSIGNSNGVEISDNDENNITPAPIRRNGSNNTLNDGIDEMMSGLNETINGYNNNNDDDIDESQCKPNEMNINSQKMPSSPSPSMHYATNLMLGALFSFWGVLGKLPIFLTIVHLILRSAGSKRPPHNFPIKFNIIETNSIIENKFLSKYCTQDIDITDTEDNEDQNISQNKDKNTSKNTDKNDENDSKNFQSDFESIFETKSTDTKEVIENSNLQDIDKPAIVTKPHKLGVEMFGVDKSGRDLRARIGFGTREHLFSAINTADLDSSGGLAREESFTISDSSMSILSESGIDYNDFFSLY